MDHLRSRRGWIEVEIARIRTRDDEIEHPAGLLYLVNHFRKKQKISGNETQSLLSLACTQMHRRHQRHVH